MPSPLLTVHEHLEGIAADLLDATCTTAPVDTYALAAACGFEIRSWSSAGAQRDGMVIRINTRARPQRRQGLIAHELGHFALERARESDSESGATYVGGALRLPRREFDHDLTRTAWSIPRLLERHVHVSATAVAVRITQLREATATVIDPSGKQAPWRVWSPWIGDPQLRRLSRWERELAAAAIDAGCEVRGDVLERDGRRIPPADLCSAFPLIEGPFARVIVVCDAEQLSLRLEE